MYHVRTKKVAAYGRRAHRVVAVSVDRGFNLDALGESSDEPSNDDLNPCSKEKEKDTNDDIYAIPVKSTTSKPSKVENKAIRAPAAQPDSRRRVGRKLGGRGVQNRQPLLSCCSNIPKSPAVPPKPHKPHSLVPKSPPIRPRNVSNISPYVDVDIIVLDDAGRRLSEERRVTKNNVQVNDVNRNKPKVAKRVRRSTVVKSYSILNSEGEEDEGDDDDEYVPEPRSNHSKRNIKSRPSGLRTQIGRGLSQTSKRSHASGIQHASDHSDSGPAQGPKIPKHAGQCIIIPSNSESENSVAEALDTKEVPAVELRRLPNAPRPKFKAVEVVIPPCPRPPPKQSLNVQEQTRTKWDAGTSVPLARQRDVLRNIDPKSHNTKSNLSASTKQRVYREKGKDEPTQGCISVESNAPQLQMHQLTPIKPSGLRTAFLQHRPIKSSPSRVIVISDDDTSLSMDDELALALKAADIELAEPARNLPNKTIAVDALASKPNGGSKVVPAPSFLRPLLSECGQLSPFDFSSFIESFPADPIIGFSGCADLSEGCSTKKPFSLFRKVGEASYSEVFGIGNVVLKVIPLLDEENEVSATWTAKWDSPPVSEARDVLKEIVVTRAMGDICKGFIRLLKAHVVQGSYPQSLLALWDHYDKVKGSESVRPDHFTSSQTYVVILLPNGGPDLENFSFGRPTSASPTGWQQACSIFWQVARSLGHAEQLVNFEHRDLHWGQILVRNTMKTSQFLTSGTYGNVPWDDPSHGVQATIIDLGLARIDRGHGDSFWTPFSEEIFEGEGDYQYDIYRLMRRHNKDEWQSFKPLTNVMWLHYLADKLINHKRIPFPSSTPASHNRKGSHADADTAAVELNKRAYDCLVDVERILRCSLLPQARRTGIKMPKSSKISKSTAAVDGLHEAGKRIRSAADVLRLGKERGWVS